MYSCSTQRKSWTFPDEAGLQKLRDEANRKYISSHKMKEGEESVYLTSAEERVLLLHYQLQLRDFCRKFHPAMPRAVAGTAFNYFKRFYLNNSVMDYHPKEILVTCVFLACKVEEFNVSIFQFVSNIKGDREKASDIIINNEMLLMRHLNYQLTVHNPFRAVEGALIDIKTRSQLLNAERLRPSVEDALDKLFLTDACLLFAPSQIALAAILHAVSKLQENLDSFVTEILLGPTHQDYIVHIIEIIRKIRSMIKSFEPPARDVIRSLEKRVERCRNQENNPDSQIYKDRLRDIDDDEDFGYASRPTQDTEKNMNEIGISSLSSNSS
ncbi:cyclin-H [Macrosteles quadrilineatus]|uniref:cyclin-H n=1 Tax=Macrosteles quadrilineatus TaxID=74068 RepID=UPI0023E339F5|nr:cyclin-H [Macrosteles quadrilineatus]